MDITDDKAEISAVDTRSERAKEDTASSAANDTAVDTRSEQAKEDIASDAQDTSAQTEQMSIFDAEEECAFDEWQDIKEIASAIAFPHRQGGSENEAAAARVLRDSLRSRGLRARLEAFRMYPRIGKGLYFSLGIWYALMIVAYVLSFAAGGLAGRLITLGVTVVFLIGSGIYVYLIFGGGKVRKLLRTRVAYNVACETEGKHTVLIASSHGARTGSVLGKKLRKLTYVALPISVGVFLLFCILKMALGADTVAKETTFIIIPVIFGALGALSAIFRYSPLDVNTVNRSEIISATVAKAYAALASEELPIRLMYASFAGAEGQKNFLAEHPELEGGAVIYVTEGEGKIRYLSRNRARRIEYSDKLYSLLLKVAAENDIEIAPLEENGFDARLAAAYGYCTDAFNKAGITTARISAPDDMEHMKDVYTLLLSAVRKLAEME